MTATTDALCRTVWANRGKNHRGHYHHCARPEHVYGQPNCKCACGQVRK